jgi:hypothetical protein
LTVELEDGFAQAEDNELAFFGSYVVNVHCGQSFFALKNKTFRHEQTVVKVSVRMGAGEVKVFELIQVIIRQELPIIIILLHMLELDT